MPGEYTNDTFYFYGSGEFPRNAGLAPGHSRGREMQKETYREERGPGVSGRTPFPGKRILTSCQKFDSYLLMFISSDIIESVVVTIFALA